MHFIFEAVCFYLSLQNVLYKKLFYKFSIQWRILNSSKSVFYTHKEKQSSFFSAQLNQMSALMSYSGGQGSSLQDTTPV